MQQDTITLIAKKAELPEQAIAEAMEWLVLTWSGEETPTEKKAIQEDIKNWRAAKNTHEQAWQYVSKLNSMLANVPGDLAASSLRSANQVSNRRQALQAFALLALGITAGPSVYQSNFTQTQLADLSTSLGEISPHTLADGTELTLNTNTAINIDYNVTHRHIRLVAGEVMVKTSVAPLATASHPARPFLVKTHEGDIRPIGTEFTVRRTDEYSLVSVQAGQVVITNNKGKTLLVNSGETAKFTKQHIEKLPLNNSLHVNAWTRGQLVVEQMRLDHFLTEIQRYRRGIIRTEPDVRALRISGTFDIINTEKTLNLLEKVLPIQLSFISKYWLTIKTKTSH